MNKSLFFDLDAQQTGQLNSLQWTNFQSFQFKRPDLANANAADVRIGERKSAQAGAEEFGLCQVALRKLDTFETAVPESGAMHRTARKTHRAQPRKGEIGELALAAFEQQVVERGFGEIRSRKFAVGEPYAVETAPQQVGVREIAVAENHVRKLRTGKLAPREETAREEASLHRKVLAVERCEVRSAERSVGDLLVTGHPNGISGRC